MPNIASLIESRFSPERVRLLRQASQAAGRLGVSLYLVGGTVRDLLLGRPSIDTDVTAVGLTPESAYLLAGVLGGDVVSRSQFDTYKLKADGTVIDLATARRESYAYPGALPTVAPGTLDEDLSRRDFSINAIAASLSEDTWGKLADPFHGQHDLRDGLVRVLHQRSFIDDATRILRAIRYAGRLDFRIEEGTLRLLRRDLGYLDTIKGERVRHELQRIFQEERAPEILALARDLGVPTAIYPALRLDASLLAGFSQAQSFQGEDPELVFAALLAYPLSEAEVPGLVSRLSMDSRWSTVVRDTVSVKLTYPVLRQPSITRSQLYHALRPYDRRAITACAIASQEEMVVRRLRLYLDELYDVRPSLRGDDLIALGVPEGPEVGTLLRELLKARLDGLVATREDEIQLVRRRLQERR